MEDYVREELKQINQKMNRVDRMLKILSKEIEHDAQWEIQEYAKAVLKLTREAFPETIDMLYERD